MSDYIDEVIITEDTDSKVNAPIIQVKEAGEKVIGPLHSNGPIVCRPEDLTDDDYAKAIRVCAEALLKRAAGEYGNHIWPKISQGVIPDVMECVAIKDSHGFTQSDVQSAIGRAICKFLNIEV